MMQHTYPQAVVTGMAVNTPLGDTLDGFYANLLAGVSAITHWRGVDTRGILANVGADRSGYDANRKLAALRASLPPATFRRLSTLVRLANFSTRLTLLCAADAWVHAGLADVAPDRVAIVVGGHNLYPNYDFNTWRDFSADPELFDEGSAYRALDTDQAASISEVFQTTGPIFTVGGACASTNLALRAALDEIRYHGVQVALVVGPPLDYSPVSLQALALIGAISIDQFNEQPERASRPFDRRREGFVPAHGVGVLVVENAVHARSRNAEIYADVLGVSSVSNASHLPTASANGAARAMKAVLEATFTPASEVDYISAHATSTPQGDLAEIEAIKAVFGDHAYRLKINAAKSMLGHCCWSSAAIETIAAILQMRGGVLHPTRNVDEPDPLIDLDVCADGPIRHDVRVFMKNAFGFGGINTAALFQRHED
jgi:3-oxoacyl-(acyl-carrier-protein) synthase